MLHPRVREFLESSGFSLLVVHGPRIPGQPEVLQSAPRPLMQLLGATVTRTHLDRKKTVHTL
jgi:hypothetical protein